MTRHFRLAGAVVLLATAAMASQSFAASGTAATQQHSAAKARAPRESVPAKEWGEISARLATIDSNLGKLLRAGEKHDYMPALIPASAALAGVFVGGLIQVLIASGAAKANAKLAERRARFEVGSAYFQWQIEQLSHLYGPLNSLLQESQAIYRGMNKVLIDNPKTAGRYRFADNPAGRADADGKLFEVNQPSGWQRFRTIVNLPSLYGKEYGIDAYVDNIVGIGDQIAAVIKQHAGYARPESDLGALFGRYLAHYSLLKQLHAALKEPTKLSMPAVDTWAAFPEEIHRQIATGYTAICEDMMQWRNEFRLSDG